MGPMIRPALAMAALAQLLAASPAAAQDAAAGKALFAGRCASCHHIDQPKSTAAAPALAGVVGRPVASLTDFNYSAALKAKGQGKTWTASELDAFLASPVKYSPGGKMYAAVTDPTERANLIAYLKTAK